MEAKLKQCFNDILITSGNVFEIINSTKSSNLVLPNNQLIHKNLVMKLNESLNKYGSVLDDFNLKFDDVKFSLVQLKEEQKKMNETKIKEEKLRSQEQEKQKFQKSQVHRNSSSISTPKANLNFNASGSKQTPPTPIPKTNQSNDANIEIIEDFTDFLNDEGNLNDFSLMGSNASSNHNSNTNSKTTSRIHTPINPPPTNLNNNNSINHTPINRNMSDVNKNSPLNIANNMTDMKRDMTPTTNFNPSAQSSSVQSHTSMNKTNTPNPADILSTIHYETNNEDDFDPNTAPAFDDNFDVDQLLAGEDVSNMDAVMMNEEDMNVFLDDLNMMLD